MCVSIGLVLRNGALTFVWESVSPTYLQVGSRDENSNWTLITHVISYFISTRSAIDAHCKAFVTYHYHPFAPPWSNVQSLLKPLRRISTLPSTSHILSTRTGSLRKTRLHVAVGLRVVSAQILSTPCTINQAFALNESRLYIGCSDRNFCTGPWNDPSRD